MVLKEIVEGINKKILFVGYYVDRRKNWGYPHRRAADEAKHYAEYYKDS